MSRLPLSAGEIPQQGANRHRACLTLTLYVPRTTCTSSSLRMGTCFTCITAQRCQRVPHPTGIMVQANVHQTRCQHVCLVPVHCLRDVHSSRTEYFVRWSRDSGADMSFLRSLLGAVK